MHDLTEVTLGVGHCPAPHCPFTTPEVDASEAVRLVVEHLHHYHEMSGEPLDRARRRFEGKA